MKKLAKAGLLVALIAVAWPLDAQGQDPSLCRVLSSNPQLRQRFGADTLLACSSADSLRQVIEEAASMAEAVGSLGAGITPQSAGGSGSRLSAPGAAGSFDPAKLRALVDQAARLEKAARALGRHSSQSLAEIEVLMAQVDLEAELEGSGEDQPVPIAAPSEVTRPVVEPPMVPGGEVAWEVSEDPLREAAEAATSEPTSDAAFADSSAFAEPQRAATPSSPAGEASEQSEDWEGGEDTPAGLLRGDLREIQHRVQQVLQALRGLEDLTPEEWDAVREELEELSYRFVEMAAGGRR